jgi:diaminopimelate decarboxylase
MKKQIPWDENIINELCKTYGTPLQVYDEQGIRATAKSLKKAFSWAKGYKNYFAVKATPTPGILKVLKNEGMGFDCSSRAELKMVEAIGVQGKDIFFTSNNTAKEDFALAIELQAVVTIDDVTQVPVFLEALGSKQYPRVAIRYNPGAEHSGNEIIGDPIHAKFGMRKDQLAVAFAELSKANIHEFGIHTMVGSNETDTRYFRHTAQLLREAKLLVESELNIRISFLNLGGGFGVAYTPESNVLDIQEVANAVEEELADLELEIMTENGRYVTGPHGYLLTKVRYVMDKHKKYIGVDASMHNLMRPGMYGAYHHISVVGGSPSNGGIQIYDVVGSLCENNDKFAVDRELPELQAGSVLAIHDSGAHGHAMGFNYNGMLRCPEVLVKVDSTMQLIRRGETIEDYFATIQW